jgi:hypothetical protein
MLEEPGVLGDSKETETEAGFAEKAKLETVWVLPIARPMVLHQSMKSYGGFRSESTSLGIPKRC